MKTNFNFVKKCIIVAVALAFSFPFFNTNVVFANTTTKTAVLNDIKVSFNGATPVTIQAYNIDGYNYVYSREIAENLDIGLFKWNAYNPTETEPRGVKFVSTRTYKEKENDLLAREVTEQVILPSENLTEKYLQVELIDSEVMYDIRGQIYKSFLYNDRMYYKLSDIEDASNKTLERYKSGRLSDSLKTIDINWNADTQVIDINSPTHNFVEEEKVVEVAEKPEPPRLPIKAPLTSAPEVGTLLADVVIDPNMPKLTAIDGTKVYPSENYYEPYTRGTIGQCTWYTAGRWEEITGDKFYTKVSPSTYRINKFQNQRIVCLRTQKTTLY